MHQYVRRLLIIFSFIFYTSPSFAHFQTLIPSEDIITGDNDSKTVTFEIMFTHPMEEGPVMDMKIPKQFGVFFNGKKHDLQKNLKPIQLEGSTTFTTSYKITKPADHIFFIAPAPYWEPAEQKMIIHYTKVIVDAFSAEDGWSELIGFPVEIEPLVRPYGLWTGNIFRGIVRKQGNPVPFAEIEVEYFNIDRKVAIPSDPYVTQVIKADKQGVFSYAMPKAGWWGFAALIDGEDKVENPQGKLVDLELGGLIWVRTRDMD